MTHESGRKPGLTLVSQGMNSKLERQVGDRNSYQETNQTGFHYEMGRHGTIYSCRCSSLRVNWLMLCYISLPFFVPQVMCARSGGIGWKVIPVLVAITVSPFWETVKMNVCT